MNFAKVRLGDGVVVARRTTSQEPEPAEGFLWVAMDGRKFPTGQPLRWTGRRFVARKVAVTAHDVLAARTAEFTAIERDGWGLQDRPFTAELLAYRQALRDITVNGSDLKSMIAAFPTRPDGSDPIAHLRSQ